MIEIKDHLVTDESSESKITFKETPNSSGYFSDKLPDTIVIHYTAGASYTSSANWLLNKNAHASAHMVIGREGEIFQLLPLNKISWHAGKSKWKGRKSLNKYSIGIELANFGLLKKSPAGYVTNYGNKMDDNKVVLAKHKFGNEELAWESYTEKQLKILEHICLAIIGNYDIKEIVGHDDIAPDRKVDPGPAFPMLAFKNKVFYGRRDDSEEESMNETRLNSKGIVLADRLNIRSGPSKNSSIVTDPLPKGTTFDVLDTKDDWVNVRINTEGWVNKNYIKYYE